MKLNSLSELITKPFTKTAKKTEPSHSANAQLLAFYRQLSGRGLALAVKAQVLGEVPKLDDGVPTFYVLREYSRSNTLLVDVKTRELGLPQALATQNIAQLHESASIIFLKYKNTSEGVVSPRLERLVGACLDNPEIGRASCRERVLRLV